MGFLKGKVGGSQIVFSLSSLLQANTFTVTLQKKELPMLGDRNIVQLLWEMAGGSEAPV